MTAGTFFDGTPYYNANSSLTKTYTQVEILHYNDGRILENGRKVVNRTPDKAVNRVERSGPTFTFWNDHDPRIVAVEFVFEAA